MPFSRLPPSAGWRHRDSREGFESLFLRRSGCGYSLNGQTAAVEHGQVWTVRYAIALDERWATTEARVWGSSLAGEREIHLVADGRGQWKVDGRAAPELDGCVDVDLESSACTNMIPVHRLGLRVNQLAEVPAVYVRALGLGVERLEQQYGRVVDDGEHHQYDYRAPAFAFECRLVYDATGLLIDYPGIAVRVA
jgi:uncharacterized protein